MLLTTHYMEEADQLCSRLAIIDNGRIVVEGEPGVLKRGIGADTILLELDHKGADNVVGTVQGRLGDLVDSGAVTLHPSGVVVTVPNASAAIPQLLRQLDGMPIISLHMRQPSLDDVFMKYAGRHIREEAADQPIIVGW